MHWYGEVVQPGAFFFAMWPWSSCSAAMPPRIRLAVFWHYNLYSLFVLLSLVSYLESFEWEDVVTGLGEILLKDLHVKSYIRAEISGRSLVNFVTLVGIRNAFEMLQLYIQV